MIKWRGDISGPDLFSLLSFKIGRVGMDQFHMGKEEMPFLET